MTSKLSLYLDRFTQDNIPHASLQENGIADLAASQPTVIKIHNNTSYLAWLRVQYPNIVRIARNYVQEKIFTDTYNMYEWTPDHLANQWYKAIKNDIAAAGDGTFWNCPYYEPNKQDLPRLNDLNMAFMRLGFPVAIGGFSNEFNLYDVEYQFGEALERAEQLGYILEIHGYDNPLPRPGTTQRLVLNQTQNDFKDSKWLYPHKLIKSRVKKVYGEFGIDNVINEKRMCAGWKFSGLSEQQYADWLIGAAKELDSDPTVIGACVFISTRNTNDTDKSNYAVSYRRPGKGKEPPTPAVEEYVVAYNNTRLGSTTPPPPDPTPDPEPLPPTGPVLKAGWNIRWEPVISDATKIATTNKEQPVEVVGEVGDWRKIVVYAHKDAFK